MVGDTTNDPLDEAVLDVAAIKAETTLKLLDLIVNEATSPPMLENALTAYRKLSKGHAPSVLFGENSEVLLIEDEYAELYAKQEIQINEMKSEIKRLKRAIDSKRRRSNEVNDHSQPVEKLHDRSKSGNGHDKEPAMADTDERPEMIITDAEWASIKELVPTRYRDDHGRERIATYVVILGIGRDKTYPWRVMGSPEKPNGWTTYYNQIRSWQQKPWWSKVVETLSRAS